MLSLYCTIRRSHRQMSTAWAFRQLVQGVLLELFVVDWLSTIQVMGRNRLLKYHLSQCHLKFDHKLIDLQKTLTSKIKIFLSCVS